MHICWGRFRKQTFSVNQRDTAVSLDQIWMQGRCHDGGTFCMRRSTVASLVPPSAISMLRERSRRRAAAWAPLTSSRDACRRPQVRSHRQSSTRRSAASASGSEPRATQPSARRCALTPPLFASRCACSGAAARLHIHGAPTMLMRSCSARTVLQRIADTPTLLSFPTALPGAFGRLFASDY